MSVKPNLNSVWQASWGTMPTLDDLWEAPADPSIAPGLWPTVPENSGFRVIPILNKGLWLTLVKVDRESALTDNQKQGLLALGFREGSNGRIIHPGYPSQGIVNAVSQVVNGRLEPLNPEQVVTLTPADQYEPKIPLAVQAGIRWFWKNRSADLLSEIVVSLSEQEDDLPAPYQSLLAGTTLSDRGERLATGPLSNPSRLQMWVSQALSGEVTPVTEPILSLGLSKGMEVYGSNPSDWPEDCQALRNQLREFRGDEPATETETLQPLFANTSDLRPPLRTRVTWEIDNGRKSGIVVALPEDDEEGLWVMPLDTQSPNHSTLPFYAPIRIRIPLYTVVDPVIQKPEPADLNNLFSQFAPETEQVTEAPALDTLFDEPAPALVEAEAEAEAETETPDAGAETPKTEEPEVEPEAVADTPETLQGDLKPQPAFTLADLPPAYQSPSDNARMAEALRSMLDSQVRALTQYGKHPLTAPISDHIDDLVAGWREDIDSFLWQTQDRQVARHNACLVARDLMLKQFNEAQPAMPGGVRSPLAVLPMGTQISGADPKNLLKEQIDELNLDWYRVGINPALLPAIQDRLQDWENSEYEGLHKRLGREAAAQIIRTIDRFRSSSAPLNELTFGPVAETYRRQFSSLFRQIDMEIRKANTETDYNTPSARNDLVLQILKEMASPERRKQIQESNNGQLFPTQEAAAHAILGDNPQTQAVTEGNRRLLTSIANLAGTSLADVEQINHPLFVVCDVMKEAGLASSDRAEALAKMGIDLNHRANWVGQMAVLSGVSIDLSHNTYIKERPSADEADDLIERKIIRTYERERGRQRATISTGFLRRGESLHPFQIGVLSTKENLFDEYTPPHQTALFIGEDGDINTQPEGRYESLGRLVDLNAISPITIGDPLTTDNQVLTVEARDKLEPDWYGVEAQEILGDLSVTQTSLLSVMHPCSAIPELPEQIGKTSAQELALTARNNKDTLMTATPAWRHNNDRRDQVLEALKLFQQDFKPIANAADADGIVSKLLKSLTNTPQAEIMVIGAKVGRRNFWYRTEVVTRSDLEKHNMDRELAVEYAILNMKRNDASTRKGHSFTSFDVTQTLRPEAIRYLNDLQENARLQRILDKEEARGDDQEAEKTAAKRRGKRQDKGLVAGLAAKDLRGKTQNVLATLDNASRADQAKFISKTKLWEAPDWVFLRAPSEDDILKGAEPMEPIVAAFFDEMRSRIASQPPANIPALTRQYAKFVLGVRDAFDRIRTEDQLLDALNPESGELAELEQEVSDTLEKLDTRPHLVLGDEVAQGRFTYGYKYSSEIEFEPAFRHILEKAKRRSHKNTHWDIKDTAGKGRRPSTSDEPMTGAMPMLSKLVRKGGKDHRGGLDISEDAVIKTFGFSGIEYGNSMTQTDRTTYLNEAYDGFMDIAELLNIPPQALSLGGTLGLAFGSRGRGGRRAALAHFEPGNNAINLTRMKGAGSMAHEYGHAFANYLYRLSRGVQGSRSPGDITTSIDKQVTRGGDKEIMGGNLRAPVAEAVAEVLRAMRYRPIKDTDYKAETLLLEGARKADRMDGRKKPYWATIEEMFARSFETYVHAGLSAKHPGFRNDFLVRPDKLTAWGSIPHSAKTALENFEQKEKAGLASKERLPDDATEEESIAYRERVRARQRLIHRIHQAPILYPAGDELNRVKGAFDKLFETLETKDQSVRHDHLGEIELPILYSHDTGSIVRVSEKEHQILAHCVMQEVARMCGPEVWVSWHQELEDEEGKPVAGRFREHQSAQEKVRAVIDLAFGAPLGTAHHEAFHFAQRHLLTQDENQMMDRHFAPDSELTQRLIESLKAEGKHDLIEAVTQNPKEAQAYAYEQWVRGKLDVKVTEQPVTVFGKVNSFFGRVLGLATHSGFSTPEQVFQAFYQGDLATRHQRERLRAALDSSPEVTAAPTSSGAPSVAGVEGSNEPKPQESKSSAEHPVIGVEDALDDDPESDVFFRQGC